MALSRKENHKKRFWIVDGISSNNIIIPQKYFDSKATINAGDVTCPLLLALHVK
jgi:hypothetical protein